MIRTRILWGLGLATLLVGSAQAEIRPVKLAEPVWEGDLGFAYGKPKPHILGLVGFYAHSADTLSEYAIAPSLKLVVPAGFNEAEFSMSLLSYHQSSDELGDQSTFLLGNPYGAYYWVWRTLEQQIRLGVGYAAPVGFVRTDKHQESVFDLMGFAVFSGMHASRELWLYAPEQMSFVAKFDMYFRSASGLVGGGQMALAELVGIGALAGLNEVNTAVEADLEVIYEAEWGRPLLRGSVVAVPTSDTDVVLGVEGEVRWRLVTVDLVTGGTLNMSAEATKDPEGKVWQAYLGLATSTEMLLPKSTQSEPES